MKRLHKNIPNKFGTLSSLIYFEALLDPHHPETSGTTLGVVQVTHDRPLTDAEYWDFATHAYKHDLPPYLVANSLSVDGAQEITGAHFMHQRTENMGWFAAKVHAVGFLHTGLMALLAFVVLLCARVVVSTDILAVLTSPLDWLVISGCTFFLARVYHKRKTPPIHAIQFELEQMREALFKQHPQMGREGIHK